MGGDDLLWWFNRVSFWFQWHRISNPHHLTSTEMSPSGMNQNLWYNNIYIYIIYIFMYILCCSIFGSPAISSYIYINCIIYIYIYIYIVFCGMNIHNYCTNYFSCSPGHRPPQTATSEPCAEFPIRTSWNGAGRSGVLYKSYLCHTWLYL